jgi:hypothetical protein
MADPRPAIPRVYFIGAGFSAGLYYPVGRDLMRRLVGYLRGEPQHPALEEHDFTNSVLLTPAHRKRAAAILGIIKTVLQKYFSTPLEDVGRVDVAEFFTMAHTLSESPWLLDGLAGRAEPGAWRGDEAPSELTLFSDLAAVTRSYFNDIGIMLPPCDDVRSVLAEMRPNRDAVINFNWDEEVDIELSTEGPGVSYTLGAWQADGGILTLKPHGSVGWYDVKQGIGNADVYFIADTDRRIGRSQMRVLAYVENEQPRDLDGETEHSPLACPPVITAPTFAKRFDYVEQHRIWRDVLELCGRAREFVFLGYSLPKDDFLTRAAIRSALQANGCSGDIRCLVVDRSFDDDKFLNFHSVFEGLTRSRNFLEWQFGSDDAALALKLKKKLKGAVLLQCESPGARAGAKPGSRTPGQRR